MINGLAILAVTVVLLAHPSHGAVAGGETASSTTADDASFWNRYLTGDVQELSFAPSAPTPTVITPPTPTSGTITPPAPTPTVNPPTPTTGTITPPAPTPVVKPPTPTGTITPPSPYNPDLNVGIECVVVENAQDCAELQPPNPVCASGSPMQAVEFSMTIGRTCNPSGNSQGLEAFCEDLQTPSSSSLPVTVLCKNSANGVDLVVQPSAVAPGGVFAVTPPAGETSFPEAIDCIYNDAAGNRIQQNIINTSGNSNLNLKDEFGAFTLVSCGTGLDIQSCLVALGFPITITNDGNVALDLSKVEFAFSDETLSLIDELEKTILPPGESSTVLAQIEADICNGGETMCGEVDAEADTPNGGTVTGTDDTCFAVQEVVPTAPTPVSPPVPVPVSPPVPVPAPVNPPVPVPVPVAPPVPVPVPVNPPVPVSPPVPVPVPVNPPVPVPVAPPVPVPVPVNPPVPVPVPVTPPVPLPVPVNPPAPVYIPVNPPVPVPVAPPVPVPFPVNQLVPVPVAPPVPVPVPINPPVPVPVPVAPPVPVNPPVPVPVPVAPPVPVNPPVPVPVPVAPPISVPVPINPPVPVPVPVTPPVPVLVPVNPPVLAPVAPPVMPPIATGPCDVDVTLTCTTSSGQNCEAITPPASNICSGSPINVVTFSYQDCDCGCGSNSQGDISTCVDISPLVAEPAVIDCVASTGAVLQVTPSPVLPGNTFSVKNTSGALPGKMTCTITTNGVRLQQNTFDTSGDVSFVLGERFGAMQVETCDDLSCTETLVYGVDIANIGAIPMTVTVAELGLNGDVVSLLEKIITNPLPPGTRTAIDQTVDVGICSGDDFSATINVVASPANGAVCQDSDELAFSVSELLPPNSAPVAPLTPVSVPLQSPIAPPVSVPAATPFTSPLNPVPVPVSVPLQAPVATPASVPVAMPLSPPLSTPATTPVSPTLNVPAAVPTPVAAPLQAPIAPPVSVPAATPVSSPLSTPVVTPVLPPLNAPASPSAPAATPVSVPLQYPNSQPVPVSAVSPVSPSLSTPATSPVVSPLNAPAASPATSPVSPSTPTTDSCPVNLGITCLTESGQNCETIRRPSSNRCVTGRGIQVMAFSFQNCDCSCGSNSQGTAASCDDFAPLVELATSVVCEASNGVALQVVPSVVLPGGIVRVRTADGGNLPEKIDCSLLGPDGTRLQQNVIDTSGNVGIEIDDEFGALQVKGCDDVSCVQRIFYDIDIANSGGLSVDITNANIQIGPSTASFMSHLSDKSLGPNESTTLDQFVELDICSTSEPLCAQVAIETATSNNGLICELTTNCCFTVDAAAPPSQGELIESGQEDTKNTTGTSTGGISPDSSLSFGFQCTFVSDSSGDSSLVGQACDSPNIVIPACSNGVPRMVTFELELSLDVVGEEPITLTSATAVTSTTGLVDVTAQIAGTVVAPGNSVVGVVVTQATIDLCTTPCEYSALFTVSGVRGPSSTSVCTNTATFVFATGATSDKCV